MAAPLAGNNQQAMMPSPECIAKWTELSVQLNRFNVIIAIDAATFHSWNHVDQQFIMSSYMVGNGGTVPSFVRDDRNQRVFLGPLAMFQNHPTFAQQALMVQQPIMAQQPMMAAPYNMAMGAQAPQYNAPAQGAQVAAPAIQAQGAAAGVDVASGRAVQNAGRNKIPRPPNAWIMYRKHHHTIFVNNNPGLTNNQLSGLISTKWHAEPQPVKDWWFNKAAEAKAEHMRKYPDYQYKPRKSSEKKRRTKKAAAASAASAVVVEVEFPHTITKLDGSPSQDSSNVQGFERIQPIAPIQPIARISPLKSLRPLMGIQAPETVQTFQVMADQGDDNVQGFEAEADYNNVELGAIIDLEAEAGNNNVQVNNGVSGGEAIGAPIDLEADNVEFGIAPGDQVIGGAMDLDAEAGDYNVELGDGIDGVQAMDEPINLIDGVEEDFLQGLADGSISLDQVLQDTYDHHYAAYPGDGGSDDFFIIDDPEELAAYDEEYDRIVSEQEALDLIDGIGNDDN